MTSSRLLALALSLGAVGLAVSCGGGTTPAPTPSGSALASAAPSVAPVTPAPTPTLSPIASPKASPSAAATASPSPTPTPSPTATDAATVSFKAGALTPANVVITTTGTVTWRNEDASMHDVSPQDIGTFRGTSEIDPGESSRAVQFNGAGVKNYYCRAHPDAVGEKGTITVVE